MSISTGFAALLGAGVGLGVLLVVIGWRGADPRLPDRTPRRTDAARRQRLLLRVGLAIAVGVAAGVVTGWFAGAVLTGLACWAVPRVLRGDPDHKQRVARVEAIATWTEMLRDTLAAASGLEQAILSTATLAPASIREDVAALAVRLEDGERLAPALRGLAARLGDPTGDLVIAALVKASEQQSRQLGDLLGALAQTAREQVSMRMRVEAGRARTRTTVRVVVSTTLTFAAVVVLINRDYLAAYDSMVGQLVLLGVGALFAVGFLWLAKISRAPEPARFLAADQEV